MFKEDAVVEQFLEILDRMIEEIMAT